jgi:hypothetical protein
MWHQAIASADSATSMLALMPALCVLGLRVPTVESFPPRIHSFSLLYLADSVAYKASLTWIVELYQAAVCRDTSGSTNVSLSGQRVASSFARATYAYTRTVSHTKFGKTADLVKRHGRQFQEHDISETRRCDL